MDREARALGEGRWPYGTFPAVVLVGGAPRGELFDKDVKRRQPWLHAIDDVTERDMKKIKEAIGRLVLLGFACHHASTCSLSTWSSPTALPWHVPHGLLISWPASRLDAFSAYPSRT